MPSRQAKVLHSQLRTVFFRDREFAGIELFSGPRRDGFQDATAYLGNLAQITDRAFSLRHNTHWGTDRPDRRSCGLSLAPHSFVPGCSPAFMGCLATPQTRNLSGAKASNFSCARLQRQLPAPLWPLLSVGVVPNRFSALKDDRAPQCGSVASLTQAFWV